LRTVGLLLPSQLLLFAPTRAPAQVVPNRTTLYLHPTDVTGAGALWVNPAGLGRLAEASIHADVTVGDPGAAGRLRQLTLGFASRGFSLGYQRDVLTAACAGTRTGWRSPPATPASRRARRPRCIGAGRLAG